MQTQLTRKTKTQPVARRITHSDYQQRQRCLSSMEALTDGDMAKITTLIYQRAGIVLNEYKRDMVFNRLSRRLRELHITSFSEYIALLESSPGSSEWQLFINALTTNLTSFFREAYHFPALAEHALLHSANYNVWCTAASTGEEPYSIAMTLDKVLGRNLFGPRIWATDIDTEVLEKARKGVYRLADIENLSPEQKKNYFLRGTGSQQALVKVRKELLASLHFQKLNLLDSKWDIPAPFDAIFCRNVMIYFDQKTREQLLKRFAKLLKPDGLLFVGHSEHLGNHTPSFRLRSQSVYRLVREEK